MPSVKDSPTYRFVKEFLEFLRENRDEMRDAVKAKGVDIDEMIADLERRVALTDELDAQVDLLKDDYRRSEEKKLKAMEEIWKAASPTAVEEKMVETGQDGRLSTRDGQLYGGLALITEKRDRKRRRET